MRFTSLRHRLAIGVSLSLSVISPLSSEERKRLMTRRSDAISGEIHLRNSSLRQSANKSYEECRPMDNLRIGIVTSPLGEAGRTPLSNLVDVVSSSTHLTCLVTGNAALGFFPESPRTIVTGVHHREVENRLSRIVRHLLMQAQLASLIARKTR